MATNRTKITPVENSKSDPGFKMHSDLRKSSIAVSSSL